MKIINNIIIVELNVELETIIINIYIVKIVL
jgi:hypothetical protein